MTSARQLEANRRNASRSTGPQTPAGKSHSGKNALRHGLATRVEDGDEDSGRIASLAAILTDGSEDSLRIEQSRIVAGCYFDLRRISAGRHDLFLTIGGPEDACGGSFEVALRAMSKISRYEMRALSKRRRALRQLNDHKEDQ
jgi:hypothetical protein